MIHKSFFFWVVIHSIMSLSSAQPPLRFQVGEYSLIAINDLFGKGVLSEIFTNGAFGTPVDPSLLTPELLQVGYNMTADGTAFYAPVLCLQGEAPDGTQFIIDTGLGPNITAGRARLVSQLQLLNIDPATIDFVFLTHGHPDHSGGLTGVDASSASLLFPSATLVMGRPDWQLWTSPHPDWADFIDPAILDKLLPVVQAGLFGYNTSNILVGGGGFSDFLPGLSILENAPGHTSDGDLAIVIKSQGETLWVLGDLYFSPLHITHAPTYGCTHDHHRQESIASRTRYASKVFEPSDLLFGMHFPWPGLGTYDVNTNIFTPINV